MFRLGRSSQHFIAFVKYFNLGYMLLAYVGEILALIGKLVFIMIFMKFIASSLKWQRSPLGIGLARGLIL